jgi:Na+-driven multidrug efflux pump
MFASAHRCTGNTRVPMFTTGISLILKVILSWIFIFGHFGFPAMGVKGAAIGTLIARSGEFVLLISLTYLKKYPVAATFRNMFDFQKR